MAAAILRAVQIRNQTGRIMSARLSLARTAALLVSEGQHNFRGEDIQETSQELDQSTEMTSWGPARRLRFPVRVDNAGPRWRYPAGHLRIDPQSW